MPPEGLLPRDLPAWEALVAGMGESVWAIPRSFDLTRNDARAVAVVVWLRLVDRLGAAMPEELPAWLVATALQESVRMRRLRHRDRFPDWEPPGSSGEPATWEPEDRALYEQFRRLPTRCRLLLRLLVAPERLLYREISEGLGIPVGSIGPTRRRCLVRLEEGLGRAHERARGAPSI